MAGQGPPRRRGAGELETEVLGALWAAGKALTPRQVQEALARDLAYNTVHTILTRLQDKGLVERGGSRRGGLYRPAKDAAQVTVERMHALLDAGDDRAEVLQRFASSLSSEDEAALRALLEGGAR
jgi:predicted transcriptional regulator